MDNPKGLRDYIAAAEPDEDGRYPGDMKDELTKRLEDFEAAAAARAAQLEGERDAYAGKLEKVQAHNYELMNRPAPAADEPPNEEPEVSDVTIDDLFG